MKIWDTISIAYAGYSNYFIDLLVNPIQNEMLNPFYFLIIVSLFVWSLEIIWPWREKQKIIRKDFWLDTFYMFFNYFFFNLLIFAALSDMTQRLFSELMTVVGLPTSGVFDFMSGMPQWARVLGFF